VSQPPAGTPVGTEAVMAEVRSRVRADLRARLVARGAADDFADQAVFDGVDAQFRRALARDDRQALLFPDLMDGRWRPELALAIESHRRGPSAAIILFVKRRILLPLSRWLYEYALENFRVQDRVNLALMSCLQSLAADHVRLRQRLDLLEGRASGTDAREPAGPPR
jgi:hypothetical protein